MKTLQYDRTYSFFEPTFAYNVTDLVTNQRIGAVARHPDGRRWYASNVTWAGGGEVVETFPTRYAAATALVHLAAGMDPAVFGGYHPHPLSA